MNNAIDVARAEGLILWKPGAWKRRSFYEKVTCYNGVGADRFPISVRWLLTIVNPLFLPAVVIHDFDYTYYKGGYWGFTVSNFRLAVNLTLCFLYALLPLLNLLLAPLKMIVYPVVCQLFGYPGYRQ